MTEFTRKSKSVCSKGKKPILGKGGERSRRALGLVRKAKEGKRTGHTSSKGKTCDRGGRKGTMKDHTYDAKKARN